MKIPSELLEKYKVNTELTDLEIYQTFLIVTDFEVIKGFESLLSEPSKFLSNLVSLAATLKEIVKYRAIAREEINKAD